MQKAKQNWQSQKTLFMNRTLYTKTKLLLWNAILRPTLTYALRTQKLKTEIAKKNGTISIRKYKGDTRPKMVPAKQETAKQTDTQNISAANNKNMATKTSNNTTSKTNHKSLENTHHEPTKDSRIRKNGKHNGPITRK